MIAAARIAAFEVLREVTAGHRTLPDALARAASRLADERDRALAAEIATGTLRWQAALDYIVGAVASRPLSDIDPDVLLVLRLSAYQVRYLERVPHSAIVNDAVDLVRRAGHAPAARFVNAVLRRLVSGGDTVSLPRSPEAAPPDTPIAGVARRRALDYLSVTLSHPFWLVSRWLDRYGFAAAETWCRFNNGHAPLTLRANTLKTTREELAAALHAEGVETQPTPLAPDGLRVVRGQPLRTKLARAGHFFVQDEASQLVTLLVNATGGQRVLDACAAPGGKTVALAGAMRDSGLLVAADVRPRRMRLLAETIRVSGARCVRLVQADLQRGLPFRRGFDAVFVDAPCSGLGTIRRDPEIKWRRTEGDLVGFGTRQQCLLSEAATHVEPGGRLVYATCSSEPEENENVVSAFLASHPGFTSIQPRTDDPGTPLASVVDEKGLFRTEPHRHGLEAFFGVALRRAQC